jgi:cell division protein FtsN
MARDYSKKKAVKRKPAATKTPVKKSTGGLIYAGIGLIVGLFIAFLVFLEEQPDNSAKSLAHPSTKQVKNKQGSKKQVPRKSSPKKKQTAKKKSSNSKSKTNKKVAHKKSVPKKVVPDYEFYTMLPDVEVEVDVPNLDLKPNIKPKSKKTKAVSSKKTSHTKKVAHKSSSTKTSKKNVALKKLYQLQVGAFSSKSKADSMKTQLAFMGVQSTVYNSKLSNGKKVYKVKIGPTSDERKLKVIKAKLKRMHINTFLHKL